MNCHLYQRPSQNNYHSENGISYVQQHVHGFNTLVNTPYLNPICVAFSGYVWFTELHLKRNSPQGSSQAGDISQHRSLAHGLVSASLGSLVCCTCISLCLYFPYCLVSAHGLVSAGLGSRCPGSCRCGDGEARPCRLRYQRRFFMTPFAFNCFLLDLSLLFRHP